MSNQAQRPELAGAPQVKCWTLLAAAVTAAVAAILVEQCSAGHSMWQWSQWSSTDRARPPFAKTKPLTDVLNAGVVLDIGCGSGLSGAVLTQLGHFWVGSDVSPHMLALAGETHLQGQGTSRQLVPQQEGAVRACCLQTLFYSSLLIGLFTGAGQGPSNMTSLTKSSSTGGRCQGPSNMTSLTKSSSTGGRCAGLLLADAGQACAWREDLFDVAVSISAVQWLLFRDDWTDALARFFSGLSK
eukprot:gene11888-14992_t